MSGTHLRQYDPADRAALGSLRNDEAAQALLLAHPEARDADDDVDAWLTRRLSAKDDRFWVIADSAEDAIGFLQFSAIHRLDRHARFGIGLLSSKRGRGEGRHSVSLMLGKAHELGLRKLWCEVREDNAAARHIYREAGFREVGVLRAHYDDGAKLWDVIVMEVLVTDERT